VERLFVLVKQHTTLLTNTSTDLPHHNLQQSAPAP
jgi:hypothetical protein